MALLGAFIVLVLALILSFSLGFSLLIALALGLLAFSWVAFKQGFSLMAISGFAWDGIKKASSITLIFVLIGLLTAAWRAAGTVGFCVYYATGLLHPWLFLPLCFLLCTGISFILGTSFGTAGTMGLVLVVLAKAADANLAIVGGAVLSGCYFGDRASPLSSTVNLIAMMTKTNIYTNLRNLHRAGFMPFMLSLLIFGLLSLAQPLNIDIAPMQNSFSSAFNLSWLAAMPAAIILILAVFKVKVVISMAVSVFLAIIIAVFSQGLSFAKLSYDLFWGYNLPNNPELAAIINGGGLLDMLPVCLIILLASAYSGIFAGTDILRPIHHLSVKLAKKTSVYIGTLITGFATSAFTCNQTLAMMLLYEFEHEVYQEHGLSSEDLALDISDTALVISGLLPWSVASATPLAMMGVGFDAVFFAVYLYLLPLCGLFWPKRRRRLKIKQ